MSVYPQPPVNHARAVCGDKGGEHVEVVRQTYFQNQLYAYGRGRTRGSCLFGSVGVCGVVYTHEVDNVSRKCIWKVDKISENEC